MINFTIGAILSASTPHPPTTLTGDFIMKKQMVISVMSKDRPGIIAGVTGAIYKLGGDVADLNQSVLCNYLSMILSVSFDPSGCPRIDLTQRTSCQLLPSPGAPTVAAEK